MKKPKVSPRHEDKDRRIVAPPRPMPRKKAILLLENLPDKALQAACRKLGVIWSVDPATLVGDPPQRPRALALLEIFESAGDLHQVEEDFLSWPREALNAPGFDGKTPLVIMQSGMEGLYLVREFLRVTLQRTPDLLNLGDPWVVAGVARGSECIMPLEDMDP